MNDSSSLSLFVLFIQGFNVSDIYELGWYAASQWMALISGVLIAISVGIRSMEENVNLLMTGQSKWAAAFTNVMIITVAIGMYFVIANIVIDIFNSIYSLLSKSPAVAMADDLDRTLDKLMAKEHEFQWSEIGDAFFSAFAFVLYWLTHMCLVLVTLAMRIAHAVLVSFCLFWGAVALPMSMTTGLKLLGGFKNLCIMVLIWPIIENFFMYLVGGSFSNMLSSSRMNVDGFDTWTMGLLVFYLTAYAVINILLIATLVSAPFVAQGMANNSGNVSGMIGSFAAAGIAAGALVTKSLIDPQKKAGSKALESYMQLRKEGKAGTTVGDALKAATSGLGDAINARRSMYTGSGSSPQSALTVPEVNTPSPNGGGTPSPSGGGSPSSSGNTSNPNPSNSNNISSTNTNSGNNSNNSSNQMSNGNQSTASKSTSPSGNVTTPSARSLNDNQGVSPQSISNSDSTVASNDMSNGLPKPSADNTSLLQNANQENETQSLDLTENSDNTIEPNSNLTNESSNDVGTNQNLAQSTNDINSDSHTKKAAAAALAASAVTKSAFLDGTNEPSNDIAETQKAQEAAKKKRQSQRTGYFANKAAKNKPKS